MDGAAKQQRCACGTPCSMPHDPDDHSDPVPGFCQVGFFDLDYSCKQFLVMLGYAESLVMLATNLAAVRSPLACSPFASCPPPCTAGRRLRSRCTGKRRLRRGAKQGQHHRRATAARRDTGADDGGGTRRDGGGVLHSLWNRVAHRASAASSCRTGPDRRHSGVCICGHAGGRAGHSARGRSTHDTPCDATPWESGCEE